MKITQYKLFPVWQSEKEEQWLNRMAQQGYALTGIGFCRYHWLLFPLMQGLMFTGAVYVIITKISRSTLVSKKISAVDGTAKFLFAAASRLGAPLMHDTALISLSDRLTDYEVIKKRVGLAAEGDFVIALYNPKSKTRSDYIEEAVNIILKFRAPETPVGIVKNACRNNEKITVTELQKINYDEIDMFSLIIISNSNTYIQNGKIITPRGYKIK